MKNKYFISGALLVLLLTLGGGWVFAQSEGVILACAAKDGALRLIATPADCKDKEILLEWNIMGPPGPAGADGAMGTQGPQGPAGPQGADGNLALAGQICPLGQFVRGFDEEGNIICGDIRPGFTPVQHNADWTPIIQEFDGVPMALVPVGCLGERCFDTPFWIDVYEVTNGQYGSEEGFVGPNMPRTILWGPAKTFCESRGGYLPDEWEWEYAARGPDLLEYPWGNEFVHENAVYNSNHCDYIDDGLFLGACEVGSRPGGASWVGAQDLAGNIQEWMENDYDSERKVIRGGSYGHSFELLRSAIRRVSDPTDSSITLGFRCSRPY